MKKGFCEHYASASALLLRAAGVPARIAVGFLGGEWNPVGGFQVVTRADAHAWVEWLDERGLWRRFDATAVVPAEDPRRDRRSRFENTNDLDAVSFWNRARFNIDSLNYKVAVFLMNFDLDAQKNLWRRLRGGAGATTAAALLLTGLLLFSARRWRFSSRKEPLEARAYREWLERGLSKGWPLSDRRGPLDNLRVAISSAPEEESRSRRIVENYIRRRFRPAD